MEKSGMSSNLRLVRAPKAYLEEMGVDTSGME